MRTYPRAFITAVLTMIAFAPSVSMVHAEEAMADEEVAVEEEVDEGLPGAFSGNFSLVTDYSFRGVSQTGREIAIQGGIDWAHDLGFYLGIWGSSIKFAGDNSFLEQDFYGGYANSIGDFSYDVGTIFFFYPKEQQYNYWEFVLNLGYDLDVAALSLGLVGSPDYFGTLGTGFYVSSGVSVPIPVEIPYVDLSIDGNAGWTTAEENILDDDEYFDWNLGLVVELPENVSLDFRYVDTDIKDVYDADARFVFGITYSM